MFPSYLNKKLMKYYCFHFKWSYDFIPILHCHFSRHKRLFILGFTLPEKWPVRRSWDFAGLLAWIKWRT